MPNRARKFIYKGEEFACLDTLSETVKADCDRFRLMTVEAKREFEIRQQIEQIKRYEQLEDQRRQRKECEESAHRSAVAAYIEEKNELVSTAQGIVLFRFVGALANLELRWQGRI